jgi:sulfotransferase family protein
MLRPMNWGQGIPQNRRYRHATSRFRLLPRFLVIGTQQAGTRSLFAALRVHRDVLGPFTGHEDVRWWNEVHFFDVRFSQGVGWYRSCFPFSARRFARRLRGHDLVAGEATPSYLSHPDVPARVAAVLPDVSLIALLRNPVDRAYWHYESMRRKGLEPLSFEAGLDAETERTAKDENGSASRGALGQYAYVGRGLYAEQLERWLTHFPRERLLALRAEDYAARPHKVYEEVVAFLGLESLPPKRFQGSNWMDAAPIDAALRARLDERFAEPNARLAGLLGGDFGWGATDVAADDEGAHPSRR